jgi:hypothetical protein
MVGYFEKRNLKNKICSKIYEVFDLNEAYTLNFFTTLNVVNR